MFRSILVPVDGSEYGHTATKYALQAARHYQAELRGLHVVDVKRLCAPLMNDVALCLGLTSVPNYEETYRTALTGLGEACLADFERLCRAASVPCTTLLRTGLVADVICQEARSVDLVVMGHRGAASEWGSRIFGSVFEATIRQINRPVLVVARARQAVSRVLAAYDGSSHASNALKTAAELCAAEHLPLHVLVVEAGEGGLAALARSFLSPFHMDWKLETASGDPAESIVAKALELDADIIAMGAYGNSRIKELLVGSTTEYVIRNAACPVLVYR